MLDSSVVGCWCFRDESSPVADAAFQHLGAGEAFVPALWWFEVRNVLVINERRGRINPAGSIAFLIDLEKLPIRLDCQIESDALLALARAHRLMA